MSHSRPDDADASLPATRRMLDRYELIAEIAKGGMGTVYLARLRSVGGFQRFFAIKLLHPHLAEQEHFVAMLLDEARLAARLHHPNAVGITDVCNSDLGYYLVMEYVDGFTLEDVLERAETSSHRDRVRLGLRILLDASVGLDAAHRLKGEDGQRIGLVHRDVSPQNILVGTDGVGRITDFGVARAAARITLSQPGMIKGKPCYMAPEQASGSELDARADVFAIGIILWETLTGRRLFESESGAAGVLYNVIHEEIPLPSTLNGAVGAELDGVCMRALSRPLEGRYQSSRGLVRALEAAAQGADLLASTHEVADAIETLFADDLAQREEAIRLHLQLLEGRAPAAALRSDIYSVPRLDRLPDPQDQQPTVASGAKARSKSGPWHEESDSRSEAEAEPGTASPEPPASAPSSTPRADADQARGRTMRVALGFSGLGLLFIALAALLLMSRNGPATPASAAEPPPATAADARAVTAPAPDPAPPAAQDAVEAPTPAPDPPAQSESSTVRRQPRRQPRRHAPQPRPISNDEPAPAEQPIFEDNPYIR